MNQKISIKFPNSITVQIKREDLLHPFISGNKFRKLKYNLQQAKAENQDTFLTFGGAFSNHIAAAAYAGKEYNFKTIGVIRGDELRDKIDENPTLLFAQDCGMQFKFVSREAYRHKTDVSFLEDLKNEFGDSIEMFVHTDGCMPFSCKICTKHDCTKRISPFEKKIEWTLKNIKSNQKHTI